MAALRLQPGPASVNRPLGLTVMVVAESLDVRRHMAAAVAASPNLVLLTGNATPDGRPDVVLAYIEDEPDSARTLELLATHLPSALLLVADSVTRAEAMEVLAAGALGVIPSSARKEQIVAAIRAVAAGLVTLPPEALLPQEPPGRGRARPAVEPLTPRELEVLRLLADGVSNKELAQRLGISDHTVKFHLASIFGKLHVSTRTEAVTVGINLGFILL